MAPTQIKTSRSHQYKSSRFDPLQFLRNIVSVYHFLLFHVHPFWIQISYFVIISIVGFLALKVFPMRDHIAKLPTNLDLFFTSVSAATVSSMGAIEMESFSNPQLVVLTLSMLLGGEVFTSMIGLQFQKIRSIKDLEAKSQKSQILELTTNQLEIGSINISNSNSFLPQISLDQVKHESIKYLGFVVLSYLVLVQLTGCVAILVYMNLFKGARDILERKGINLITFSFFTIVSSFANCGFVPTNENMVVFRVYSSLLLVVSAQVLLGNTMFASTLRFLIWVLKKVTKKKEFHYMLENHEDIEYDHLLPGFHAKSVAICVSSFLLIQFVLFCSMEWGSEGLEGLGFYSKLIAAYFMSVNSRHAGESIVDLSVLSPAILVLYIVMMYLPPYTCFMPIEEWHNETKNHDLTLEGKKKKSNIWKWRNYVLSQLSYLAIFLIIICITERRQLHKDPLNFNVLNIVFEIVSAYGNVGFSTGYSCKRRLNGDGQCIDEWISFSGKWTGQGKVVLMVVMLFGRLKKFNLISGGTAWKLA